MLDFFPPLLPSFHISFKELGFDVTRVFCEMMHVILAWKKIMSIPEMLHLTFEQ